MTKHIRLATLSIKDGVTFDAIYEESDDQEIWLKNAMALESFGLEQVQSRLEDLKPILTRAYGNLDDAWDSYDLSITKLTIAYVTKVKKGEELKPGAVLTAKINGELVTHESKEPKLNLGATMYYSPDGRDASGYLKPSETVAIEAIARTIQESIIAERSRTPDFKSVQLELRMD